MPVVPASVAPRAATEKYEAGCIEGCVPRCPAGDIESCVACCPAAGIEGCIASCPAGGIGSCVASRLIFTQTGGTGSSEGSTT